MSKKKKHRKPARVAERELTKPKAPPRSQARPTEREQGMKAFTRNDYDGAIAAWAAVLRAEPSLPVAQTLAEAHFRRACLNMAPNAAKALEDLQAANNLMPDHPIYIYHRGVAYHRTAK